MWPLCTPCPFSGGRLGWNHQTNPVHNSALPNQRCAPNTGKVKRVPCECSPESFTIGCDTRDCSSPARPGGPSSQHRGSGATTALPSSPGLGQSLPAPSCSTDLAPVLHWEGSLSHRWVLCRPCSCTAMVFSCTFA